MSMVHASRGFLKPPGDQLKSEPAIIAGIAKATLGPKSTVDWERLISDYDLIRDAIEAVLPDFESYNDRIRKPGGFRLPNSAAMRVWNTATQKANFFIFSGLEEDVTTGDSDVLRLMSLRAHDQYNTTIYGLNDRYRGVFGRRDILFANPADIERLGFSEGDVVDVATALEHERADRVVRGLTLVSYNIPVGCCACYYPESQPLVALEHCDKQCLTPSYKSIPVRIRVAASTSEADTSVSHEGVVGRPPIVGSSTNQLMPMQPE
jgi:anaerobic selenocysteine-containing dehydrogenase